MKFLELMPLGLTSAVLVASFISAATVLPHSVAKQADRSLSARDAYVSQQAGTVSGASIKSITMPTSAQAYSIAIGKSGAKIFGYMGKKPLAANLLKAKRAYIMIHGRDRNANQYYSTLNAAYNKALTDGYTKDSYSIRYAPDFFSAALDSKVLNKTTLAWGDPNAWSGGDACVHPSGAGVSPFEVLDGILDHFANKAKFPKMEKVVFIGHGAGAQVLQRYAVLGQDSPTSGVSVRYVIGEPSSTLYFTVDRPAAVRASCTWFDDFRYGLSNYDLPNYKQTYPLDGRSGAGFFARYLKRDVRYLVGMKDISADSGDQTCPAVSQGGAIRRDRLINYWAYLHLLAGITPTPDYPGYFPGLDSNTSKVEVITDKRYTYRTSSKDVIAQFAQTSINHLFSRIPDAAHTGTAAFTSTQGLSAIFS